MDRRRSRRYAVCGIEATLTCAEWLEGPHALMDLSMTGAYVATEKQPELGEPVTLVLTGEGVSGRLVLMGQVVAVLDEETAERRRLPAGVGVAFESPTPQVARELATVLEALERPMTTVARVPMASLPMPDPLRMEVASLRARVRALEQENARLRRGTELEFRAVSPPPPPLDA
jgi:Tfp pilus assembly protein PilZ